jgi:uncharacterized membrane protein YfcA
MTLFGWAGLGGTTFAAALLQTISGFGFTVLAVPLYLLLAGTAAQTVRATLLAFFALSYGATVASHAVTVGIPGPTWMAAGILAPFALLGGLAGRPIGDRIGSNGFALLAIALLTVAGLYTVAAAGVGLVSR